MRLVRTLPSRLVVPLAALAVLAGCAPATAPPAGALPAGSPASPAPPADAPAPAAPPGGAAPPSEAPPVDVPAYSTTDPDSLAVIVNKTHPVDPVDHEPPDLVVVRGYLVRAVAADDLAALLAAADADGVHLTLRSAYRSYRKQQTVHAGLVAQLGEAEADRVSARAGHSEHQTGLAVDVGSSTDDSCDFEDCFADTVEGRWVAANAARFGFVVRYTAANEAVTGYAPEAWHLRYVGRPLVEAMAAAGVTTLEKLFGVPGGADYS